MTAPTQKYLHTDDRRRAIASAARSLIVEKGFEGLRTREIADRVGINIATLHYHVPSKEALIELVAMSLRDELHEQHLANPRDHLPPVEQLRVEFEQFRELTTDRPETVEVMDELHRRAKRDENVARYMMPMRAFWIVQIEQILAAGIRDGTFRADLDPKAGARMVIGALIISSPRASGDADTLTAVFDELIRSFLSPSAKGQSDV